MPQNRDSIIIAGPLQTATIAYRNKKYVADRVFPILDNVPPEAKIARYLKGAWFRDEAGIRAPGTRANRGGHPTDYIDIALAEYAMASEVTDEDVEIAEAAGGPPLKPYQDAVEFAADKVDLKKEVRVAGLVKDSTWADGNAAGEDAEGLWAPPGATNTFLTDIATGRKAVQSTTGQTPNVLVIDFATYEALKQCEAVLDKIKYTQRGVLTKELLAAICDLDEVLVGEAIKNTAKETKAGTEFTASYVWEVTAGKGMGFLFYRPPSPGLKIPMAGLQARGKYRTGGSRQVKTWREEAEGQDVYQVSEKTHIVATGTDLGYKWKDTFLN